MAGAIYEWGAWRFERSEWRLRHADQGIIALPNKTLELLALLVERAPQLVVKDDILNTVWADTAVEEGNIAFHVAMLRKTLDADDAASCIETVRGRGYRFVLPVTVRTNGDARTDGVPSAPPVPAEPGAPAPSEAPSASAVTRQSTRLKWAIVVGGVVVGVAVLSWLGRSWFRESIRSVAVAPFSADAGGANADRVQSGLTEALAARVAEVALIPVAPAASIALGDTAVDVARRAGADAVITGNMQRNGERWRVGVQLTRVADGRRIWSWAFDVADGSASRVQADIAERIAVGYRRRFGSRRRAVVGLGTESIEAYDFFLQAREQWRQRTPASVRQAITLYERAIALDPSYAQAYAGLADCYNLTMSGLPPAKRHPAAKANAERAVALAPSLAEGHTSLAFLRYKFEWKWADAEAEFKRAISLNPRYALAHHWYGEYLGLMGRFDEAVMELRQALEIEPRSQAIMGDLVPPLLRAGRIADAREVLNSAAAINPDWHWVLYWTSEVLKAEGHERESAESRWRWMLMTGSSLETVVELRDAYRRGGRDEMTRAEIRQRLAAEAAAPGGGRVATDLSFAYGRLGERAEAFRWLGIAIDRREDAAIHLLTNPDYAGLRDDPEFGRLLARVGLKK